MQVLPLCQEGKWRCPSCLDLCNCSGRTCSRFQKGLEPTEQLHSEAVNQGFKSVCFLPFIHDHLPTCKLSFLAC